MRKVLNILLLAVGMLFIGCVCQSKPNPIPAKEPTPEFVDTILVVHFAFDSSIIEDSEKEGLSQEIMLRNKDSVVSIVGHADSQGSAEYNMKLSARRAEAVSKFLKGLGVDNVWSAKGEEQLLNDDETINDHRANRRAEISFKIRL